MKLTVERADLAAAMSRIATIVDRKQTIPILSNVCLTASGHELTLRGTNLDMEAVEVVDAHVETPGTITVPVDMLNELARNLPQGAQVSMTLTEAPARLLVASGRSRVNLPVLPSDSFPTFTQDQWTAEFEIDADKLAHMLGRVSFAQSVSVAYAYLQGVYLHPVAGRLRAVATNRNVVSYADGPEVADFPPVTVPTRMVAEMARMTGKVTVQISGALVRISNGSSTVTSKLMDASKGFPDYMQVIPKSSPLGGIVNVADLAAAIRRAMISRKPGDKEQTVRLAISNGAIAATARNEVSDALDEIDFDYQGGEVTLPLNPTYLLDILAAIPAETVCVTFGTKTDAMVWVAPGDADGMVVVMPQRV